MENVSPAGALARRSRQWIQLAFLIVTGGVFLAILGLSMIALPFVVPSNPFFGLYNFSRTALLLTGIVLALAGVALAIRAYLNRIDNDLAARTGNYLKSYLDHRFWFVRNISKRGLGYIDAVLVGPPGALVFRVLDVEGVYANEKGSWLRQDKNGQWLPARINPTAEDIVDIKALREYLTQHGMPDIPVYGVIVFTKEEPFLEMVAREPVVPATHLSNLFETIRDNYLARDRIDQATVNRIVDLIYDRP
jgi:uncharacterized membrane protein YidH (DUF202 family)